MMGLPAAAEIDVLNDENAQGYWERSDRFDTALDLTGGRPGLAALARIIEAWVAHLLSVAVTVEPVTALHDVELTWYVGLDAHGTRIGDALWRGEGIDEPTRGQVVGLFRLTFLDANAMDQSVRGAPVYLILAMTPEKVLRMKPQNLIAGLPVRRMEPAA
jgi:hypothetical protein